MIISQVKQLGTGFVKIIKTITYGKIWTIMKEFL